MITKPRRRCTTLYILKCLTFYLSDAVFSKEKVVHNPRSRIPLGCLCNEGLDRLLDLAGTDPEHVHQFRRLPATRNARDSHCPHPDRRLFTHRVTNCLANTPWK